MPTDRREMLHETSSRGSLWQRVVGAPVSLMRTVGSILWAVFLPSGWPRSVAPEYLEFQVHDTLQALCSYLRGILATRATLQGLGVGDANTTVYSSTLTWIFKDGVSLLTGLAWSWGLGHSMDVSPKFFRLVADIANDVALTVELLAPLAGPEWFLPIICIANALRAVCGVSAGCTRTIITAHFARDNNSADVSAKEASQETAVTLAGIVAGSALLAPLDESESLRWLAFAVLTIVHVWANARAVAALRFSSMDPNRLELAMDRAMDSAGEVPTTDELVAWTNAHDPIWPSARWPSNGVLHALWIAMTHALRLFQQVANRVTSPIARALCGWTGFAHLVRSRATEPPSWPDPHIHPTRFAGVTLTFGARPADSLVQDEPRWRVVCAALVSESFAVVEGQVDSPTCGQWIQLHHYQHPITVYLMASESAEASMALDPHVALRAYVRASLMRRKWLGELDAACDLRALEESVLSQLAPMVKSDSSIRIVLPDQGWRVAW